MAESKECAAAGDVVQGGRMGRGEVFQLADMDVYQVGDV